MLTLYHGHTSVCSQKVRLVLAEKGLEFDGRLLDLTKGDQFDPDYMKMNPGAVVPTLVDGRRVVIESTIINEYLDDAYPAVPLRPDDAHARALMRLWTKQLDDSIHVSINTVSFAIAYRHPELAKTPAEREARINGIPDPARREKMRELVELGLQSAFFGTALRRLDKLTADMEQRLAESQWLAGDRYSLADAGLTPYLNRTDMMGLSGIWDDGRHPRLRGWLARVRARPNFAAAITAYDPPERIKLMNTRGADAWPQAKALLAAIRAAGV